MNVQTLIKHYSSVKEESINELTTTPERIYQLIQHSGLKYSLLGNSVQEQAIYSIELGEGKKKVLIWTQMHGNEPTATKAIFDLINFFRSPGEFQSLVDEMLKDFKMVIIPMLNPDGALLHRRTNAMDIDLNRDAVALQAPESRILRRVRDEFRPKYCFNLHDQSNVYNVSGTGNTATISFLAPAEDFDRTITDQRKESMAIINVMNSALQGLIPSCVGRYNDAFYPTATGDNFQKDKYITMLIESGAYPSDNEKEMARKCNFVSILSALEFVMHTGDLKRNWRKYNDIPHNDNKMLDVLIKNVKISLNESIAVVDIGVMYTKHFNDDRTAMIYKANIVNIGDLCQYYGIKTIDMDDKYLDFMGGKCPQLGDEINIYDLM